MLCEYLREQSGMGRFGWRPYPGKAGQRFPVAAGDTIFPALRRKDIIIKGSERLITELLAGNAKVETDVKSAILDLLKNRALHALLKLC